MNGYNNFNSNNQQNNNLTMDQLLATNSTTQIQPVEQVSQKKWWIVIVLIILLIAGGIGAFILLNHDKVKEIIPEQEIENLEWSGIYKNGSDYVKVYQLNETTLYFDIITEESRAYSTATINGNKAEAKIYATYTLELNDNKLKVTSTDEYMLNATYTKKEEYTKEDIYKDNYGDPNVLNTNVNGTFYYERKKGTIDIYQIDNDTANFTISNDKETYNLEVNVIDGKVEHVEELADETITIAIDFTEEELKIKIQSSKGRFFNSLDGTYKKTGSITMDDILNERLK